MPPPIARTYHSREAAEAAAQALKAHRVTADPVHVVGPAQPAGGEGAAAAASEEAVLSSVLATGLAPSVAPVYAEGVRRGETLVVVYPLLGRSHRAKAILHGHEPTGTLAPEVSIEPEKSGAHAGDCCAAPLSTALGWPVLSSDPTPLSSYLKWSVLKPQPASSRTREKIRRQSSDPAPMSRKLGMRLLSDDPAPLSRLLRWSTRSSTATPLSSRFGWRVLLDDPTPFSTLLGWRVLKKPKARRPARYVRYL